MQILIALIIGAAIGIAAHLQVPHRQTRGAAVIPVLGTIAAGVAWLALTFVVPAVVCWPAALLLARVRLTHDARERAALGID